MEYYQFFVDAWRLFKKYKSIATNSEEYFAAVVEATKKLVERYRHRPFAEDITLAIVDELVRIAKAKGEQHE